MLGCLCEEVLRTPFPRLALGLRGSGRYGGGVGDTVACRDLNVCWGGDVSGLYGYLADVPEGRGPGLGVSWNSTREAIVQVFLCRFLLGSRRLWAHAQGIGGGGLSQLGTTRNVERTMREMVKKNSQSCQSGGRYRLARLSGCHCKRRSTVLWRR